MLLERHASGICYSKDCGEWMLRGGGIRNWCVKKVNMCLSVVLLDIWCDLCECGFACGDL